MSPEVWEEQKEVRPRLLSIQDPCFRGRRDRRRKQTRIRADYSRFTKPSIGDRKRARRRRQRSR